MALRSGSTGSYLSRLIKLLQLLCLAVAFAAIVYFLYDTETLSAFYVSINIIIILAYFLHLSYVIELQKKQSDRVKSHINSYYLEDFFEKCGSPFKIITIVFLVPALLALIAFYYDALFALLVMVHEERAQSGFSAPSGALADGSEGTAGLQEDLDRVRFMAGVTITIIIVLITAEFSLLIGSRLNKDHFTYWSVLITLSLDLVSLVLFVELRETVGAMKLMDGGGAALSLGGGVGVIDGNAVDAVLIISVVLLAILTVCSAYVIYVCQHFNRLHRELSEYCLKNGMLDDERDWHWEEMTSP